MENKMSKSAKRYEIPIVAGLLTWGTLFLLKLPHLHVWVSAPISVVYLWAVYAYIKARYDLKIPFPLMFLVWASVALDIVGNLRFGGNMSLYDTKFRYFQYDEFTHTAIPALVAPVLVWLLRAGLDQLGYRLPLGLVTFFAMTTMFTVSGFYEVIELWDDKYMWPQPGMRIHGAYDTPTDLQCDLLGLTIGGLTAYVALKRQVRSESRAIRAAA
jgi:uncharacterized membrane protein YjdF